MTSRIFSYSPNNKYANDYYLACKKFDNIRQEVIDYENKTTDFNPTEYKKLQEEFAYWDKEVPRTSNIAGREEERLKEQELYKDKSRQGNTIDFMG